MGGFSNVFEGQWPRVDPRTGLKLCRICWNGHPDGLKCYGHCDCPRRGCFGYDPGPKRVKFTGEGQTSIPMDNPIIITPKS